MSQQQQQPIFPQDWEIVRTLTPPLALQQRVKTTTTTVDLRYALGNDGLVYWCRSHSPLLGEWRVRPLQGEEIETFLALYPDWEPIVSTGDRGNSGLGVASGQEVEAEGGDDGDEGDDVSYHTGCEDNDDNDQDEEVDEVDIVHQQREGSETEDEFQNCMSTGAAAEGQTQGGHHEPSQVSENGDLDSERGISNRRLPACTWHRYPAADRWVVERGLGPELVLTTPEGENFWLDDLTYYHGARSWADFENENEGL